MFNQVQSTPDRGLYTETQNQENYINLTEDKACIPWQCKQVRFFAEESMVMRTNQQSTWPK